ncbi:MAG: hypothetical protein ACM34K_10240 [Bacillota bacterium]
MKIKNLPVVLLFVITFLPAKESMPWGDKGHRLIARKAFECLPKEMFKFNSCQAYVVEHSVDPDYRKKKGDNEYPRHFIDIDYYPEFRSGKMIENLDSLERSYGDSIVTLQGVLPWTTQSTLSALTQAFKEYNKEKILLYASDLAHYVADGFQPLHASLNYNGQLSSQKGIHSRYESKILEKYEDDILRRVKTDEGYYINDIHNYIFDYVTSSNIYADIVFDADRDSYKNSNENYNDEYYRLFWFRTQYLTIGQISSAARTLASLYYTAWINAGKPPFEGNAQ